MVEISVIAEISDEKKKKLVAGQDLFSEFSLPVTFVWYWPLMWSKKLGKPKSMRENPVPSNLYHILFTIYLMPYSML